MHGYSIRGLLDSGLLGGMAALNPYIVIRADNHHWHDRS